MGDVQPAPLRDGAQRWDSLRVERTGYTRDCTQLDACHMGSGEAVVVDLHIRVPCMHPIAAVLAHVLRDLSKQFAVGLGHQPAGI